MLATGKTLEEIDILFARSPEMRERLERNMYGRRHSVDHNGQSRRGSRASGTHKADMFSHDEKA